MAKKIEGYLKLQVPAGQANPSPPIGPALGQRGLNIMEFCKSFNAASQNMDPGVTPNSNRLRPKRMIPRITDKGMIFFFIASHYSIKPPPRVGEDCAAFGEDICEMKTISRQYIGPE